MQINKVHVHWTTKEHNISGNALGYNAHNSAMRKFSEPFLTFDDEADIALHINPADLFVPIPGKINVLFTMWESPDVPNCYLQRIVRADVLIVPCTFCRDILRPHFNGPIYVCREGVDPSKLRFHQRVLPRGGKFRFLWVGAPNPRKGYQVALEIAQKLIQEQPELEMYFKTTTEKMDRKVYVSKLWQQRRQLRNENHQMFREMLTRTKNPDVSDKVIRTGQHNNIIWDSRRLPFNDLVELYNSAHCFLFPTFGEGWGLTLCEAMATGIPSIATEATGVADYFDESVGYPISYTTQPSEFHNYKIISRVYCPDVMSVVERMKEVIGNYDEALSRGKKASARILNKFTWQRSAERLHEILTEVQQEVHNTCAVSSV